MNEVTAIAAEAAVGAAGVRSAPTPPQGTMDFGRILADGLAQLEQKIDRADELVRTFTLDGSVPVHQVSVALEEARLAVELALQVRTRLVEGYREIMNMQL